MKKIAGAAGVMMVIIFLMHFTVQMVSTIDMSAVNGTAMENVSKSVSAWSAAATALMTPAVLIIAIGTVIMAVYTLTRKRR